MPRAALTRALVAAALVAAAVVPAAAQQSDPSKSACTRDVSRVCRSVMNDGDSAVLMCLKEHRARLSKGCQKVLTDNNQ